LIKISKGPIGICQSYPKTVKEEYFGNPGKFPMGCISVRSPKEKMVCRKIDVPIVYLAEIFSTNHDREIFFIQGEVRRGADTSQKRSPIPSVPMWRAAGEKNKKKENMVL
jgi:hypothetical protein